MRYRRGSDVVYRNGAILFVVALAGVFWIVASIGDLIRGREGAATWALIGLLVLSAGIYLNLKQRVVLGHSRLHIHTFLSTEQIPYESIAAVRFTGQRPGSRFLEICLADGSKVGVHPRRASLLPFHRPGWQGPLADEVMDRVELARNNRNHLELPTGRSHVVPGTTPRAPREQDSRSDRERQDRMRLVFAVAAGVAVWVLVVLLVVDQPLPFLGSCAWFAATVLTVTFAVKYLRQRVLTRIPARFTQSPSKPIRILTMVAKGLAIYVVGLLAFAAALDVPTFFIQHL